MPHADLDGLKLHYQQMGQGPDVVLLHGLTSNLAMWLFSGLVPALAGEFRVTSYDLRGHGLSDAPPDGYTSVDMAHDLKKLHERLELGPTFMLGHSFGGVVAMHAARLYPEIVSGVILSDSYFPGLDHLEPNMEHAEVWQDLRQTYAEIGYEIGDTVNFQRLFDIVLQLSPEEMKHIEAKLGPPAARWLAQLPQLAKTTAARDAFVDAGLTAAELCRIEQPVVALYDEHTPFEATCRFLTERLPHATRDVVPGARHLALLESPELFVQLVQKHLRRLAGFEVDATPR